MTILEAGKILSATLNTIYEKREASNIAEMVMENLTGFKRSERLLRKQDLLTVTQLEKSEDYLKQLLLHKPIQYVLQEAWFAGFKFYVDENVLIPRPETEELVEWIIADLAALKNETPVKILDIGTGSGCIPITLKKKCASSVVYALDINAKALEISKKNAANNNAEIEFIQADILNLKAEISFPKFDIIVSNPPYVTQSEAKEMDANVLLHEPSLALFVPNENPLIFYSAIANFALENLKTGTGKLYFEINELMGEIILDMLTQKGLSEIKLRKDFQGKNRMISATLKK